VSCDWLAGLVVQGLLAEDEATDMAADCAIGLAQRAYRVPEGARVQAKR
jgi:glucuronate isomerase